MVYVTEALVKEDEDPIKNSFLFDNTPLSTIVFIPQTILRVVSATCATY